jgi:hypothetical protein
VHDFDGFVLIKLFFDIGNKSFLVIVQHDGEIVEIKSIGIQIKSNQIKSKNFSHD